ncbi:MAG: hypothetical protein RI564_02330 [Gracilimonas sp.]|nr:hypothetical protein [Gracilimonas sp.]
MANERTYNRDQINRILSETLMRQKKQPNDDNEGLTEEELMHIADEVGLDRKALKETLLNFNDHAPVSTGNFLTGNSRLNHIEVLSGEINDEIWDDVQIKLRGAIGGLGVPKKTENAYELEQVVEEIGYKHLSLIPKDGNTRIEYSEEWPALKILVLIISFMMVAGLTLITLKELGFAKLITILFAPFGGLVGIGAGLGFLKYYYSSKKSKLKKILKIVSDKLNSANSLEITIEKDAYNADQKKDTDRSEKLRNPS